jgi:hypothetical protein
MEEASGKGRAMDSALRELIEDAITVASYGQRSGRFKDNMLFVAIQRATAAEKLDWSSPETVDLQAALNSAVQAIHPVTLVDLKSGWNPFSLQDGGRKSDRKKKLFVAVAAILILLCGYYTVWYQRATLLLADLSNAKVEQQNAIMNELFFRLVESDDSTTVAELGDSSSFSRVAISEKIDQLRLIDKIMVENKQNYNEILVDTVPGQPLVYYLLGYVWQIPKSSQYSGGCGSTGPPGFMNNPTTPVAANDPLARLSSIIGERDQKLLQIRCIIGLTAMSEPGRFDYNSKSAADLRRTSDVLGFWVLPGLYGALGALMFFMRAILSPFYPDPSVSRVALRIALGVFAGIAIVWFWSPSTTQTMAATNLTLGSFTIAFLVGFSIDVFFALLDRLVTLATMTINKLGAAN